MLYCTYRHLRTRKVDIRHGVFTKDLFEDGKIWNRIRQGDTFELGFTLQDWDNTFYEFGIQFPDP